MMSEEEFNEELLERQLAIEIGEYDCGQCDKEEPLRICSEEYVLAGRFLDRLVNCGYAGAIGPLDESMTVFREVEKKFFSRKVSSIEYFDAHEVYLASIK